jgi:hypothetical protein
MIDLCGGAAKFSRIIAESDEPALLGMRMLPV